MTTATDTTRCAVCGWPLAPNTAEGCVPGNCFHRPVPDVFYDHERAEREYGVKFEKHRPAELPVLQPAIKAKG